MKSLTVPMNKGSICLYADVKNWNFKKKTLTKYFKIITISLDKGFKKCYI